jgi:hypothetical protein
MVILYPVRNAEAIRLYREILRTTRIFTWRDDKGRVWGDILRENARKEFEQSRFESDNVMITRLLIVGWDCVNQTKEKYSKKVVSFQDNIDRTRTS